MGTFWIYKIAHDGVSMNLDMTELFSETAVWSITIFGQNQNTLLVCSYKGKKPQKYEKELYCFLMSSLDGKHLVKHWTKPLICFSKP